MIRISRTNPAPAVLTNNGPARVAAHASDVARGIGTGPRFAKLVFDRAIYSDPSVKSTLIAMQHEKCAFCEAKPLHVSSGDVEHFRPKAAFRQGARGRLKRPGYYWLAYEWTNLLFACESCNRRHKKSLFALVDESTRCTEPHHRVANEAPVFIDPTVDDPEAHIGFRAHVPFAVANSPRGKATINALGLARPELNADRERHLGHLWMLFRVTRSNSVEGSLRSEAAQAIAKMTADHAEYAAMCRAAIQRWDAGEDLF